MAIETLWDNWYQNRNRLHILDLYYPKSSHSNYKLEYYENCNQQK